MKHLRLVDVPTAPGDCADPDHAGLRELLTTPWPEVPPAGWGADVSTVFLLIDSKVRENRRLMLGRDAERREGIQFVVSITLSAFVLGFFVAYMVFGIGGR